MDYKSQQVHGVFDYAKV